MGKTIIVHNRFPVSVYRSEAKLIILPVQKGLPRDREQYSKPSKAYTFKIGFAPFLAMFNIKRLMEVPLLN